MLPDDFEEFEVVYAFLDTFCFSLSLSVGKRSTLRKIPPPSFYGPEYIYFPGNDFIYIFE